MPRKPKGEGTPSPRSAVKSKDIEWGGFLDIRISDAEKTAFDNWQVLTAGDHWLDFVEEISRGLKFGLSYDKDNDCYIATFTGYGQELIGLDARYCMQARAPAWETSVALLMYKHLVIAQQNWGNYRPRTKTMDNFG